MDTAYVHMNTAYVQATADRKLRDIPMRDFAS